MDWTGFGTGERNGFFRCSCLFVIMISLWAMDMDMDMDMLFDGFG